MGKDEGLKKIEVPNFGFKDPEKAIEEAVEGFRKDAPFYAELQKLGLTNKEVRDNLPALIDYQINFKECKDTDPFPEGGPEFEMSLVRTGGNIEVRYSPRKRELKRLSIEANYIFRDFPDSWLEANLKDVNFTKKRSAIVMKLGGFLKGDPRKWMYLTGEFGTGKSYILAAYANSLANQGETVAFCNSASIIDKLRNDAVVDKKGYAVEMEQLKNVSLLVLDGFGDEYKSDFALSTVLYPILSSRSREGKQTMFTSDFTIEEINSMYSAKINAPRARQLCTLIKNECSKEKLLEGLKVD